MTKYIAVWGSTGAQGSAVVQEALAQGLKVRAIARSKQRIADKFQEQVEACEADLLDLESATNALRGVDVAFAHLPITADSTQPPIFLQNLIAAARQANLPLLVFTTSGPTGERYDPVPMIAGTTAARDAILNSGIASIVLQPTVYLENLLVPLFVPRLYTEGVLDYPPIRETQRLGWVSHKDQAKYAVAGCLKPELAGKAYEIFSLEPLTGPDLADIFASWLGQSVRFEVVTPQAFGERMATLLQSQELGKALAGLYEAIGKLPDDAFDIDTKSLQQIFGVALDTVQEQIKAWPLPTFNKMH